MEREALLSLQNGSDVRGVALEVPGGKPVNLTERETAAIAAAFVRWLAQRLGREENALWVGVGHDSRLTAPVLKGAALRGIQWAGGTPLDCGLASTPAMFMGTVFEETGFDGAIMLTASHLPKERNGMKFFTRTGGLDKGDITALLTLACGCDGAETGTEGAASIPLMDRYAAFLRQKITEGCALGDKPLDGLHLVVDAGNGAGG
ncbi:MAG: phosphomannomutase/phosphoglucomutase, partial [Oscillospiraceae bacterium]|nr:phosphomannomutase/phosphoglucomutase [Oscillospiraceae bacterium]